MPDGDLVFQLTHGPDGDISPYQPYPLASDPLLLRQRQQGSRGGNSLNTRYLPPDEMMDQVTQYTCLSADSH